MAAIGRRVLARATTRVLLSAVAMLSATQVRAAVTCAHTVTARVVALEQVYQYNRFGAFNPEGLVYALQDDVEATVGRTPGPGNARLRSYKRPRPLVLRVNEGDCLQVTFRNWLAPVPTVPTGLTVPRHSLFPANNSTEQVPFPTEESEQLATRHASIHVNGLDYMQPPTVAGCLTGNLRSDGAFVGNNDSSLVAPGGCAVYKWYAKKEGGYLLYSMGAHTGGEGDGGQPGLGLFGSVNVEPARSRWYRSQVTSYDLTAAARQPNGTTDYTKIDYAKLAIADSTREIRHSDLNAVIYQQAGSEECAEQAPTGTCGLSFREFTVIFHDELTVHQAFAELADEENPISSIRDGMGINYGSSSMGAAVLANAKGIGPAKDCAECKFEEFFLSSWPNGDPALLVQYPDDPSNVHHSYLGDPVRFRNLHAGPKETHVFHLHAHQWLQDEHDQNSTYLDSQTISPGAAYTYEIQYGGGGNRNYTVGDSIFHCHLYPHFAQGMWELWRNHDVFEDGTAARNLPDFELTAGTPNPALVPIPGFALPPRPTPQFLGYPFYVAAQAGHRPPQPPLDMDDAHNGGLPRHIITSGTALTGAQLNKHKLFEVGGKLPELIANRVDARNSDPNLTAF
ncbi:MAG: manganese oxidase, partial [Acidobacteriota bacterium]|nr:manganese oxidase [Acidobacteriota bacterium]